MLPTTGSTIIAAILPACARNAASTRVHIIIRQCHGGITKRLRYALRIGDPQGRHARTGLHQQRIHVAVVAAFELHDEVAPGEAAGHANGRHGGFGAGVHQPHHLDGGDGVADRFRQLNFLLRGRAEAGADLERAFERRQDFGMPVAQQQRSPGADVIDVLVAIHVEDVAPSPRARNGGLPPTLRNARTGEFTPPGIRLWALRKSASDLE